MQKVVSLLCFIFFTLTASLSAADSADSVRRQAVIDSLNTLIESAPDTTRIEAMVKRSNYDKDTAERFDRLRRAVALANEIGDGKRLLTVRELLAKNYLNYRKLEAGIAYALQTLQIAEKYSAPIETADNSLTLSNLYREESEYGEASEYALNALKLYEQYDNKNGVAAACFEMGLVNYYQASADTSEQSQYSLNEAFGYYERALNLYKELGKTSNVANLYNSIAGVFFKRKDIDQAQEYVQKAASLYEEAGLRQQAAQSYNNLAFLWMRRGEFKKAKPFLDKSYEIKKGIGNDNSIISAYQNYALYYNATGNPDTAINFLERVVNLARKIDNKVELGRAYLSLSKINESGGNYQAALENFKRYRDIKDTIYNEEQAQKLKEQQSKYESEKKDALLAKQRAESEKKDAQLAQQQAVTIAIAGGLVLVLALAFVSFRAQQRTKKTNKKLQEQKTEIENKNGQLEQANEEIKQQAEELQATLDALQQTQRQLIEAEKMASLGQLTAGVAHEINTPVGIGVTATSYLVDETQDFADKIRSNTMKRSELKTFVNNVYKSGKMILGNLERAADLVSKFKQVAVSSDDTDAEQTQFDLNAYVADTLAQNNRLTQAGITFTIDGPQPMLINHYQSNFGLILQHLTDNVVEHAFAEGDPGQISVTLSETDDLLEMTFADNGKGIPEENLPKLFEPFFTTNRGQGGGAGLGLHIVYNLVTQRMGGQVVAESTEGQGARFRITVPKSA